MSIPYFSADDVKKKVDMPTAIRLMADAFGQLAAGKADIPIRTHIHMPSEAAQSLFMPAYLENEKIFGLKVVGMNDHNPARGLPFIHAHIFVLDAVSGQPKALVDGTWVTALRTGAGAGLATDLLARKDATVLALFGAGVQARTQLQAVCAVRNIDKVWLFNRTAEHAWAFAEEMMSKYNLNIQLATHPDCLSEADIVCTATTSSAPVFSHEHLKPGVHINAVGAYRADMAEIPPETVCAARVFVDQRAACWVEAGDLIQPKEKGLITEDHIAASLGEVVNQTAKGRTSPNEITLFKSVGNAVQDLVVANFLVEA